MIRETLVVWFPSPYGVTVIKSSLHTDFKEVNSMFPSPYGVTVIKSNIFYFVILGNTYVSVPLRGNGN